MKCFKTSEIAKAVGVHPNTVRLYEEWGFLQLVPRNDKGYRLFTQGHLEQMKLARIALRCEFVEGNIRERATVVVKTAALGKLEQALEEAYSYQQHIRSEQDKAREALVLIRQWINGKSPESTNTYKKRSDVARLIGVSIDILRNWERNGLVDISRDPDNNYRVYGPNEINKLKIIRTLRAANCSFMAIYRMMRHLDKGTDFNIAEVLNTPGIDEDIVSAADRWIVTLEQT